MSDFDDFDDEGSSAEAHTSDGKPRPNDAFNVTSDELRQFVERLEQLAAEKKDISDQEKEVKAEAKGRGFDTKVLTKIIALRKRDANEVAEEEAILEVYKSALGMI